MLATTGQGHNAQMNMNATAKERTTTPDKEEPTIKTGGSSCSLRKAATHDTKDRQGGTERTYAGNTGHRGGRMEET